MQDLLLLTLILLLASAVLIDIRWQRVPNWLSLTVLSIGFASQTLNGLWGFLSALGGMAVGLVGLGIFYLRGGMGAGDVKLMAAVGSYLGIKLAALTLAYTLVLGGVMAVFVILTLVSRRYLYQRIFTHQVTAQLAPSHLKRGGTTASGQKMVDDDPTRDNFPRLRDQRFPYVLAITLATLVVIYQFGLGFNLSGLF